MPHQSNLADRDVRFGVEFGSVSCFLEQKNLGIQNVEDRLLLVSKALLGMLGFYLRIDDHMQFDLRTA